MFSKVSSKPPCTNKVGKAPDSGASHHLQRRAGAAGLSTCEVERAWRSLTLMIYCRSLVVLASWLATRRWGQAAGRAKTT